MIILNLFLFQNKIKISFIQKDKKGAKDSNHANEHASCVSYFYRIFFCAHIIYNLPHISFNAKYTSTTSRIEEEKKNENKHITS